MRCVNSPLLLLLILGAASAFTTPAGTNVDAVPTATEKPEDPFGDSFGLDTLFGGPEEGEQNEPSYSGAGPEETSYSGDGPDADGYYYDSEGYWDPEGYYYFYDLSLGFFDPEGYFFPYSEDALGYYDPEGYYIYYDPYYYDEYYGEGEILGEIPDELKELAEAYEEELQDGRLQNVIIQLAEAVKQANELKQEKLLQIQEAQAKLDNINNLNGLTKGIIQELNEQIEEIQAELNEPDSAPALPELTPPVSEFVGYPTPAAPAVNEDATPAPGLVASLINGDGPGLKLGLGNSGEGKPGKGNSGEGKPGKGKSDEERSAKKYIQPQEDPEPPMPDRRSNAKRFLSVHKKPTQ